MLMAGAGVLWVGVLVYLLTFEGVPAKTMFSAIFFVVFFSASLAYYAKTAIIVDGSGLTYRGVIRTRHLAFADIRKVEVLPGPITVYAVRGKSSLVHFTSFFAHHRRLMTLLVEQAGLGPLHA